MENNAFTESFKNITDFRQPWKIKRKLIEIIFIAVVATIANSNNWVQVETFAKVKIEWLKKIYTIRKWCSVS